MGLGQSQEVETLAHAAIGAAVEVHHQLGPGQLESAYHPWKSSYAYATPRFKPKRRPHFPTKNSPLVAAVLTCLLGDTQIVVELKAVNQLAPIHDAQLIAYLKNTNTPLGLLLNFNAPLLVDGLRRFTN